MNIYNHNLFISHFSDCLIFNAEIPFSMNIIKSCKFFGGFFFFWKEAIIWASVASHPPLPPCSDARVHYLLIYSYINYQLQNIEPAPPLPPKKFLMGGGVSFKKYLQMGIQYYLSIASKKRGKI